MRIGVKIGVGAAVLGLVLGTAQAAGAAPPPEPASTAVGASTVTLLTGDQVTVQRSKARSVRPGQDRAGMTFAKFSAKGHDYVIPADALPLIAAGKLDRRLFDITALIEFGYDDAHRDSVPLIVTNAANRAAPRLANATRNLPSVNGIATAADKTGTAWEALTNGTAGSRTMAAGVSKVWLDGKRKSTLDHSVPQIGAPAAWEAGFTGEGIKVAVLDTGVDQTHPDLADREVAEQNFSEAPDNVDNFGHGTHVASIVAGTGAKSGGTYRGVAWGASILDGKVLDDFGFGSESGIIAGMQWAAEHGADVANLSLGGGDTVELDPLEEAVNSLSEQYGTLFVIAAGNSGPGSETVGSPGSADAALTVGAVDREDNLADFSSRGPRLGDGGIKPDITAPGVDIVAAKAANGQIGDPAADGYVALSGTSMATPHVAGAAALIAQQHPEWTGAQLKAALTASATPTAGLTAFEQGAGRVDVARTLGASVVSEPTSVSLGVAEWPHDDDQPVTKSLTYRNLGDSDVTLALALDATDPDGGATDMFTLSANEVTVPAGGEATVDVTADTRKGTADGTYSGAVVATAGESTTRTPVAVVREVESYDLTLNYVDENGAPTADYSALVLGLDNDTFSFPYDPDGSLEVRLPKGRYVIDHLVFTDGGNHFNHLAQPGLALDGDMAVDVDPRITKPISVTPPAEAQLLLGDIGYLVETETSSFGGGVITDDLSMLTTAQLGDALPGTTVSGAINTQWLAPDGSFYGLAFYPDGYPTGFTKVVEQDELATVRVDFGSAAEGQVGRRVLFPIPESGGGFVFGAAVEVGLPSTRTEYLTTEGARWSTLLGQENADQEPTAEFDSPLRTYRAGRTYHESFGQAVFGPGLPATEFPWGYRIGDELGVGIPMFSDFGGNAGYSIVDTSSTKLYRGEELVGESPEAGYGVFTGLPAESGEYRLTTELTRSAPFDLSTEMSAEWTFTSAHVDGEEPAALALNAVRYLPLLDDANSAPAGRFLVPVLLQNESGAHERPRRLTVEASYDEGKTWQRVPVLLNLVAALNHPTGAESVSLRASATDRDGNTVKQTVIRAYKLRK
ncbi:MAG: S8 family peptidase [Actinophytocola sp.]|uniref:S8 family peptidase n=1 Tax=Actinophytocola sp. TaxID=1872138 RepID=UPI003D6B6A59